MEELIISIRLNRGDVLYADDFKKYYDEYLRLEDLSQQRPLSNTEKSDLAQLYRLFQTINRKAEALKPYFSGIFEAREDALTQAANDYAPESFIRAEKKLLNLATKFPTVNPSQSDKNINEILVLYREAEFEAVRNKLLSEVRILIRESEDLGAEKDVPQSYSQVMTLFSEVEQILATKNFDDPTLGEKASLLLEASKHLLYLTQHYQQIDREGPVFENYVLKLEKLIGEISEVLNDRIPASDGPENMLIRLKQTSEQLQAELTRQNQNNRTLLDSIVFLNRKIYELQERLGENLSMVSRIERLKQKLDPVNVKVIHQNDAIILRANGIDFPLGKIQIADDDKLKLEKIGESVQFFPGHQLIVRLGQKSNGNEQYNKALAEQRVRAAALIIQSAGYIDDAYLRSEVVLMDKNLDTGHAIVDVIIELQ
jgi:outer membrane protein OmpA-like peptidoglycan-associated protein